MSSSTTAQDAGRRARIATALAGGVLAAAFALAAILPALAAAQSAIGGTSHDLRPGVLARLDGAPAGNVAWTAGNDQPPDTR